MATDADRIVALERLLKREKERNRKQTERLERVIRQKSQTIEVLKRDLQSRLEQLDGAREELSMRSQTIKMLTDEVKRSMQDSFTPTERALIREPFH